MSKKQPLSKSQKALNLWAVILIIWSLYRAKFSFPIWFDEFIAKPLVFVVPVYFYIKKIEKKNFFEEVGLASKNFLKEVILGILLGFFIILPIVIIFYLKGKTLFSFSLFQKKSLIIYFLLSAATSFSEEILSRGFVTKRLFEESKNIYHASFLGSFFFFILHIPLLFANINITGKLLVFFMISDIILSLTVSFLFLERKNLIPPIFVHFFYNLSFYLFV